MFTFNSNFNKAKNLCKNNKNLFSYKLDIKKKSSIKKLYNFIEKKFKKLDVIVNNAGINKPTDFDKIKEKDWDNILQVNLKGPFMVMQEFLKLIKKSKEGSIINVSSVRPIWRTKNSSLCSKQSWINFLKSSSGQIF